MKRIIASALALSVLVAAPAWAEEATKKAKESSEATESSESGVESIAEEAADAPAEIPNALKGDQPETESLSD
jgi:hypothetical protein